MLFSRLEVCTQPKNGMPVDNTENSLRKVVSHFRIYVILEKEIRMPLLLYLQKMEMGSIRFFDKTRFLPVESKTNHGKIFNTKKFAKNFHSPTRYSRSPVGLFRDFFQILDFWASVSSNLLFCGISDVRCKNYFRNRIY